MKRCGALAALFGVLLCSVYAQQPGEGEGTARQTSNSGAGLGASSAEASQNIMLARSSAEYMVTPGDVYTLAYAAGGTAVSYVITVDSTYRIRVSNLGVISGAGKTFMRLKSEAEAVVSNNYPLSGVQLVLTQPAVFRVHLGGEVQVSGEVNAWGLSRLSSLAGDNLTAYASQRDVEITAAGGRSRTYDLFKARREGDLSEDPYLRPGDRIRFKRASRVAAVEGAVERPGRYQLLGGEHIRELIEYYGGGFTPVADRTRVEMVRMVGGRDISGEKVFLTERDIEDNYELENYDAVSVPEITGLRPVMFVEGAVGSGGEGGLMASNRDAVSFSRGETYASVVRRNRGWFTAVSDTRNAYIIRGEERIGINLNPMLYDAQYRGEMYVMENDTLVIPFRQYFVTVAGAVANPGRYPYIPDRDWEYYIGLAGGFVAGRNAGDRVVITGLDGRRMKKGEAVSPETTITASTNHTLYYFNQYAVIVTTVLTIISTIFSIQAYTNR